MARYRITKTTTVVFEVEADDMMAACRCAFDDWTWYRGDDQPVRVREEMAQTLNAELLPELPSTPLTAGEAPRHADDPAPF